MAIILKNRVIEIEFLALSVSIAGQRFCPARIFAISKNPSLIILTFDNKNSALIYGDYVNLRILSIRFLKERIS